jgi:predicted Na+-dependent transporter
MSLVSFFPLKIRTLVRENFQLSQMLLGLLICYTLLPALQMILASFFLDSKSLQLGVLLASLSPVAIIAPQLLSNHEKQRMNSLLYVVISTLLYPALVFVFIHLYNLQTLNLPFLPLLRDSLIITLLPLLFSIFFDLSAPKAKAIN